jgi:Mrp family chromosome partitioning ATPase
LSRYTAAIRRRRWIVVASILVFAIGLVGYVKARPGQYDATAEVLIKPYSSSKFGEQPFTTAQVDTQVAVMKSLSIVGPVAVRLGLGSAITLQKSITSAAIGDTSVISVTASSDEAGGAARIANAMAARYVQFRDRALPPKAQSSFATVVSRAHPPQHRSGTGILKAGAFGVIVGIVIGCAVAIIVDRRDRSVLDETRLAEVAGGLPVLSRIPVGRRRIRGPWLVQGRGSPEAVAYRFLATTVRLLHREHEPAPVTASPIVVVVVSAAPQDGRTSVAANLAFAAAEGGSRVLVCDADLTQPSLTKLFGLHDDITLESLLRRAAPVGLEMLGRPAPNVYALGTSGVPVGQSALLGNGTFRALVSRLPGAIDLVIVDTSPLLSSADVLDLVPQADEVVFVVREQSTIGTDVTAALERLRQADAPVAGIVVTGSHAPVGTQRAVRRRTSPVALAEAPASAPAEEPDSASITRVFKR